MEIKNFAPNIHSGKSFIENRGKINRKPKKQTNLANAKKKLRYDYLQQKTFGNPNFQAKYLISDSFGPKTEETRQKGVKLEKIPEKRKLFSLQSFARSKFG